MKLFAALALLVSTSAFAYVSPSQFDPRLANPTFEHETTTVQKSAAASYNTALTRGMALYYSENELTGLYKVSNFYSGTGTDAASAKLQACIIAKRQGVAQTDTFLFPCITRGYVDYALFDATTAISKLDYLCITPGTGVLKKCDANVVSKFVALEAKASGTGTMKVQVK